MIPKKIHYCWLSGEDIPIKLQKCIHSWQEVMPEYQIILWDKKKFNIQSVDFVKEACRVKKWAFAADYIRLYALYTEGGIYLDADVLVKKKFDPYLNVDFFSALEYFPEWVNYEDILKLLNEDGTSKVPFTSKPGIGMQAAVLGSIKEHPFIGDCLEYYKDRHFILDDNSFSNKIIAPDIFASVAENYGFRYKDEVQHLKNNMLILPHDIFASGFEQQTENTYAVHCITGSWQNQSLIEKIVAKVKENDFMRKLFRKPPLWYK